MVASIFLPEQYLLVWLVLGAFLLGRFSDCRGYDFLVGDGFFPQSGNDWVKRQLEMYYGNYRT